MSEKFKIPEKQQSKSEIPNDKQRIEKLESINQEFRRQFSDARKMAGEMEWNPVKFTMEASELALNKEQLEALDEFFKTAEVLKTHFTSNK